MTGHETEDDPSTEATTDDWRTGHTDPESLRDREAVPVDEKERTFEEAKFEGLRRRYEQIDGVVLVGVTTDDGEVLLQGDDTWSPPGASVEAGEDWADAARRGIEQLTGVDIQIDRPVLVEITDFCLDGDESTRFPAPSIHFEASLSSDATAFREDPTFAGDVDGEYYAERELAWFDELPDDAHPNHEEHIELYLD